MCPSEERKLLLPSTSSGFLPAVDLSDGARLPPHGTAVRGGRKILPGSWLKILWPVHLTGQMEREGGYVCPRKVHRRNRPQGWRQEGGLLRHQAQFPHRQVCRERRSRRDRGGATGTVAASRVFTHRTVAAARNRASGFGGDWRCASSCLSESGLTTGCRQAAGSRSGRNKDNHKR